MFEASTKAVRDLAGPMMVFKDRHGNLIKRVYADKKNNIVIDGDIVCNTVEVITSHSQNVNVTITGSVHVIELFTIREANVLTFS